MAFYRRAGLFSLFVLIIVVAPFRVALNTEPRLTIEAVGEALDPPKTRNLRPLLDLTVNFDFDSASIQEDSKHDLRIIGAALVKERLVNYKFRIEGHTDAEGTTSYNQRLSERRPDAVVAFLTAQGVARDRLKPVGKGFSDLLEPDQPTAARNRRVRVLTVRD